MDRDTARTIQLRAFRDFIEMLAGSSPGASAIELDGVAASIVPAVPRRSVVNSVIYRDAAALAAAHDELAGAYEAAGVEAWTVWAPEFEREAIEFLEDAGHALDGQPGAMVADLSELEGSDVGDLDWDVAADMAELGALNDRAYGHDPGEGFGPALASPPGALPVRLYQARVDGELACGMGTIDHAPLDGAEGPDCGVYFVATSREHRGRGLATRLMLAALIEARERGCATSSLQASALGEPVYARLGYRTYFRFHMYERRR